jgi:hypothetical protein
MYLYGYIAGLPHLGRLTHTETNKNEIETETALLSDYFSHK